MTNWLKDSTILYLAIMKAASLTDCSLWERVCFFILKKEIVLGRGGDWSVISLRWWHFKMPPCFLDKMKVFLRPGWRMSKWWKLEQNDSTKVSVTVPFLLPQVPISPRLTESFSLIPPRGWLSWTKCYFTPRPLVWPQSYLCVSEWLQPSGVIEGPHGAAKGIKSRFNSCCAFRYDL